MALQAINPANGELEVPEVPSEPEKPIGLFGLLRRLMTKDGLRGLAAATDFLQAFGRHLHSLESPNLKP